MDTKTIKLKHIAPYLPYKLMVHNFLSGKQYELSVTSYIGDIQNKTESIKNVLAGISKPILRNMKDLMKEIEVNGEKFVPIEKFEIGDDSIADLTDTSTIEYNPGNIKLIASLQWIAEHNAIFDLIFLPYGVIQKLFEWHFDVFGLIEKGLAITKEN
jgi:hypothetical protein